MPKHKIKINDTFVFTFPKLMPGSESDTFLIPSSVLEHFIENCGRFKLKDSNTSNRTISIAQINSSDLAVEPPYWLEIEITFSGEKLGGTLHRPDFIEGSRLDLVSINKKYIEDDLNYYLEISLEGEAVWEFKSNYYKKYLSAVENAGSKWENAKLEIRINFRTSHILKTNLNRLIKDSVDDHSANEYRKLKEILDSTPNIPSLIRNYKPEKKWELELKYWQNLKEKELNLEGPYLREF
jgi:hypothetical protein